MRTQEEYKTLKNKIFRFLKQLPSTYTFSKCAKLLEREFDLDRREASLWVEEYQLWNYMEFPR